MKNSNLIISLSLFSLVISILTMIMATYDSKMEGKRFQNYLLIEKYSNELIELRSNPDNIKYDTVQHKDYVVIIPVDKNPRSIDLVSLVDSLCKEQIKLTK